MDCFTTNGLIWLLPAGVVIEEAHVVDPAGVTSWKKNSSGRSGCFLNHSTSNVRKSHIETHIGGSGEGSLPQRKWGEAPLCPWLDDINRPFYQAGPQWFQALIYHFSTSLSYHIIAYFSWIIGSTLLFLAATQNLDELKCPPSFAQCPEAWSYQYLC